jgi:6-phosphogluconolactonase (cycloisomerase 2 family)
MYDMDANSVSPFLSWDLGSKICNISTVDSTLLLVDDAKHIHFLNSPYDEASLTTLNLENEQFEATSVCFHPESHRLFLMTSNEERTEGYSSSSIYSYNLNQHKLNAQPLFSISGEDIEAFAIQNKLIAPHSDLSIIDDTLESMNFTPSAIAVHPKTNEIYVLSRADHSLVVFNQFGDIVNFTSLDKTTFSNPSAMTFKKNGDLVITDGNMMNPTVIQVKWNKLFQSKSGHGLIFGR